MIISTKNIEAIKPFIRKINLPKADSHKGQNGRILIIGGSSLFHAASIWAAEIASHFVDIVHYSSTVENNQVFLTLKKKFHNGIIVARKDLIHYIQEDDVILVGPGMVRKAKDESLKSKDMKFEAILKLQDEAEFSFYLTQFLIDNFPEKKFVFDAGASQMMDKKWLLKLNQPAIITPHQQEFATLFGRPVTKLSQQEKINLVTKTAADYHTVILFKAVIDIISDGHDTIVIEGGNQGLTKGGSGDLLAGLTTGLFTHCDPLTAAVLASYTLKKSSDQLYPRYGYWYNMDNLIEIIPQVFNQLII